MLQTYINLYIFNMINRWNIFLNILLICLNFQKCSALILFLIKVRKEAHPLKNLLLRKNDTIYTKEQYNVCSLYFISIRFCHGTWKWKSVHGSWIVLHHDKDVLFLWHTWGRCNIIPRKWTCIMNCWHKDNYKNTRGSS